LAGKPQVSKLPRLYQPREDPMHKHILMPTDGSELSQNAVDYGMALAK
jgi:hypothetical protein